MMKCGLFVVFLIVLCHHSQIQSVQSAPATASAESGNAETGALEAGELNPEYEYEDDPEHNDYDAGGVDDGVDVNSEDPNVKGENYSQITPAGKTEGSVAPGSPKQSEITSDDLLEEPQDITESNPEFLSDGTGLSKSKEEPGRKTAASKPVEVVEPPVKPGKKAAGSEPEKGLGLPVKLEEKPGTPETEKKPEVTKKPQGSNEKVVSPPAVDDSKKLSSEKPKGKPVSISVDESKVRAGTKNPYRSNFAEKPASPPLKKQVSSNKKLPMSVSLENIQENLNAMKSKSGGLNRKSTGRTGDSGIKPKERVKRGAKVVYKNVADSQAVEYVGSVSDLLYTIGGKVANFSNVSKKPRGMGSTSTGKRGLSTPRSIPQSETNLSLGRRQMDLKLSDKRKKLESEKKDLGKPKIKKLLPGTLLLGPTFRFTKIKQGPKVKPLQKKQPSKKSGMDDYEKLLSQRAATLDDNEGSGLSGKSLPTQNSGTEDYEKFLAQRAKQLDRMATERGQSKGLKSKALPSTLSGSFDDIADTLNENIRTISNDNKDKSSRRARSKASSYNLSDLGLDDLVNLDARSGPNDGKTSCPCYVKYSPLNIVRRTTKRIVRAVRTGSDAIADGVDFSITKAKDIKDAFKADIIDPTVKSIPLVGEGIGAVVDFGDSVADSSMGVARNFNQGNKALANSILTSYEGVLKKDKTCACLGDASVRRQYSDENANGADDFKIDDQGNMEF